MLALANQNFQPNRVGGPDASLLQYLPRFGWLCAQDDL